MACFENQSSERVRFKKRSTATYKNSSWSFFFKWTLSLDRFLKLVFVPDRFFIGEIVMVPTRRPYPNRVGWTEYDLIFWKLIIEFIKYRMISLSATRCHLGQVIGLVTNRLHRQAEASGWRLSNFCLGLVSANYYSVLRRSGRVTGRRRSVLLPPAGGRTGCQSAGASAGKAGHRCPAIHRRLGCLRELSRWCCRWLGAELVPQIRCNVNILSLTAQSPLFTRNRCCHFN